MGASEHVGEFPGPLPLVWETLREQMTMSGAAGWKVSALRVDVSGAWTFAFN
ncbi:hypothetical protein GCM10022381_09530 [Leifsonia kafniensis]|uniref:DUF4177 domain-containing protein n=1 Tax=Leifsonia kafniensis TaxID=475957 RepID=A0ABP7K7E4_9MICO